MIKFFKSKKVKKFKYSCILLNDTSFESHYGCDLVMKNLNNFLNEIDIKIVVSIPCGKTLKNLNLINKTLDSINLVIINGEGTFHDDQKWAKDIVLCCEKIKLKKNVPILLLNALVLNNSKDFMERLKLFDFINVRDAESKKNIEKNTLKCFQTADFSFYEKVKSSPLKQKQGIYILVNDSVDKLISNQLFNLSIENNFKFVPIRRFNKIKSFNYNSALILIKNLIKFIFAKFAYIWGDKSSFHYINYYSRNINEFFNILINSKGVLTGRFHSVCFCIVTKKPFLAVSSNTPKIEILCKEVGLNIRLRIQEDVKNIKEIPNFERNELNNIEKYIKKSEDDFILLKKEIKALLLKWSN